MFSFKDGQLTWIDEGPALQGSSAAPALMGPTKPFAAAPSGNPAVPTVGGSSTSGTASSASAQTVATGAVPSWIAALKDAALKADISATAATGTVTEAAMVKLFTDLANELTTSKGTLSASQLTDLKAIVTNLNVGETASAYVTYIVNALVNGNAANAFWTGGGKSAAALGNLAAGATATQLNELTGKWLLGTDLPSDVVAMSGSPQLNITYATVSAPLFGASGPSINDVNQGDLGDCFLLASLAEVAKQNPSLIQSMISSNGNGTYGVQFYVNGAARYVTVNSALPNGGTIFNTDSAADWVALVEKAYAQLQASGVVTGNSVNYGNSFSTIGNGGLPEYTLEEITNASTLDDYGARSGAWTFVQYNSALSGTAGVANLSNASVLATLVNDLGAGDDLVVSSNTNAYDSSGKLTLVADHALSIYGFDSATGMLELRNPWGVEPGQSWDTTFEVGLNALLADGDTISVANTAPTPAPNGIAVSSVATNGLSAICNTTGLAGSHAIASLVETGGNPVDSFRYSLAGNGASSFQLSAAGALSTGSGSVIGAKGGKLYALTVTATDTTASNVASPAMAVDVVVGQGSGETINLATIAGITAAAPTFAFGAAGNDTIIGAGMSGPLYIAGGGGGDTLSGGSGSNNYEFGAITDSTPTAMDIITNFTPSHDYLDLTAVDTHMTVGALAANASALGANAVGWATSGGNTFVYVDTTSKSESLSAASMKIELQGNIALTGANLLHG